MTNGESQRLCNFEELNSDSHLNKQIVFGDSLKLKPESVKLAFGKWPSCLANTPFELFTRWAKAVFQ